MDERIALKDTPIASSSWDVPQSHVPKEVIVCNVSGVESKQIPMGLRAA